MKKRSRTEITIETERRLVIRNRKRMIEDWCEGCARISTMATPEEVVDLTGISSRSIYRLAESGAIHFIETEEGLLLVCLNSVALAEQEHDARPSGQAQPCLEAGALSLLSDERADAAARHRKAWTLTPGAFDKLLAYLDPNRERAGEKYETIRRKLIKFFECRGCGSAEDQADETINRVARRMDEGQQIWASEPAGYFYGVARNVLKEYRGAPEREFIAFECLPPYAHPGKDVNALNEQSFGIERQLQALELCIEMLSAESRELLLRYYQGEKGGKIRNRKSLAKRLGIPPNALRIRVHRIRASLEKAVSDRLLQSPADSRMNNNLSSIRSGM
jgi:DNA-directed RNA polymerase specialized sigma24 family protein